MGARGRRGGQSRRGSGAGRARDGGLRSRPGARSARAGRASAEVGRRRKARELSLQLLYQMDVQGEGIPSRTSTISGCGIRWIREVRGSRRRSYAAPRPRDRDRRADRAVRRELGARAHGGGGPQHPPGRDLRAALGDRRPAQGRHQRGPRGREEVQHRGVEPVHQRAPRPGTAGALPVGAVVRDGPRLRRVGRRGPPSAARRLAVAAVAGAALHLAFPRPGWDLLGWVALAPVLALAATARTPRARAPRGLGGGPRVLPPAPALADPHDDDLLHDADAGRGPRLVALAAYCGLFRGGVAGRWRGSAAARRPRALAGARALGGRRAAARLAPGRFPWGLLGYSSRGASR